MFLVTIAVPFASHPSAAGLAAAPAAWQSAGLAERLAPFTEHGIWVTLSPPSNKANKLDQTLSVTRQLMKTVRKVREAGALPLVLGGDSLLTALGTVAGLQQLDSRLGLAWFDAHYRLAPSQILSMLTGWSDTELSEQLGLEPIPDWRILLAGVRSQDPDQATMLDESGMTLWEAHDLRLAGADGLAQGLADWPPVYLHLDLGVLDPSIMPATYHPIANGLALETLIAGIESVAAGAPIAALGISGLDPSRDQGEQSLMVSMQVIESAVRLLLI